MVNAFADDSALEAGNPAPSASGEINDAGPSSSRPAKKRASSEPRSRKAQKASRTAEQEAKQRHKAIERVIAKAQKATAKKTSGLQAVEPAYSSSFTSQQLSLPDLQVESQLAAWSPNGAMEQPGNRELFFGSLPVPRPPGPS